MKKLLSIFYAACLLGAAGCSSARSANLTPAPQELTLYDWADYMPRSVLDAFQQEYGIQVRYVTYGSMEEAVAEIRAGGAYDVAVVENGNIRPLAKDGLLAGISQQNIPNFKNISPDFRDLAFDPNNDYSIPYDYGTTGLLVRSDRVAFEVTRWADLWDPRFTGRVAVRPMAYELIGMSLKSLGYPLNTEDPQALDRALRRLLELKPSMVFLDTETSKAVPSFLQGDAVVMLGWGNDALRAQQDDPQVEYILPEEGTLLWGESFVMPSNGRNRRNAELFLNFILRPEISARITNENHYATANGESEPFIDPEILDNPIVFPPRDMVKKADWYLPLSPAGQKVYADVWQSFMKGN